MLGINLFAILKSGKSSYEMKEWKKGKLEKNFQLLSFYWGIDFYSNSLDKSQCLPSFLG